MTRGKLVTVCNTDDEAIVLATNEYNGDMYTTTEGSSFGDVAHKTLKEFDTTSTQYHGIRKAMIGMNDKFNKTTHEYGDDDLYVEKITDLPLDKVFDFTTLMNGRHAGTTGSSKTYGDIRFSDYLYIKNLSSSTKPILLNDASNGKQVILQPGEMCVAYFGEIDSVDRSTDDQDPHKDTISPLAKQALQGEEGDESDDSCIQPSDIQSGDPVDAGDEPQTSAQADDATTKPSEEQATASGSADKQDLSQKDEKDQQSSQQQSDDTDKGDDDSSDQQDQDQSDQSDQSDDDQSDSDSNSGVKFTVTFDVECEKEEFVERLEALRVLLDKLGTNHVITTPLFPNK